MVNKLNLNLLFLLLLCGQEIKAQGRFEDADHGNDFGSRFGDNGQWDIRHNIPGEPDVDYPIYSIVPRTSFTCENRHEGYYADIEARCQAFRICANTAINGDGFAFLCPNGTLFSQRKFICDWYKNVDCTESENFYFMNEEIGKTFKNKEEMLEAAKHMIEFPLRNVTSALTTKATTPLPRTTQRPYTTPPNVNKITTFKPAVTFASFTTRSTTRPTFPTTTTQRPSTTTHSFNNNKNNNNKDGIKERRPTTRIPITKEEAESVDLTPVLPPGNVYVSNLGELSTDIGSTFDPKSSLIIGDGSDTEPEAGLIDIRGSFGDTSKKTETHDVFRQNIDHVRNSFPANVNSFFSTPESQSAIKSGHAVSYQIQNRYTAPESQASTSSLTLAQKINAGLNGLAKISVADGSNGNNFLNKISSGEGNLITHAYYKQPLGKSLNFADTVNSAFQQDTTSRHQSNYAFSDRTASSAAGEQSLGNGFVKPSQQGHHRAQVDDFRRGRQFQFQGSGFSRGDQKFGNDQRNAYLPPSGQRHTPGSGIPHSIQGTTGTKENKGQARTQGFTSTFNGFKIYPSQTNEDSKAGSSYVELPGTKIQIAKSQEQGHFTISNDPYQKQGAQSSQTPNSGYQPLEQYLKDSFPGQKQPQQSYHQTYSHQTHQQNTHQQTTNFYLPFPTVSTTKRPTGTYQIFPSVSQQIPSTFGHTPTTTKAPFYGQTPTVNSFSIGTKPFSPFLEGIPIQRRLDIVEDEKEEGSLYTGVSSYHVPISSVGRLPGDLVALRKRRRS